MMTTFILLKLVIKQNLELLQICSYLYCEVCFHRIIKVRHVVDPIHPLAHIDHHVFPLGVRPPHHRPWTIEIKK